MIKDKIVIITYAKSKNDIKSFKSFISSIYYFVLKGLKLIKKLGNNVKTNNIAKSIANPVNIPKYIVGIKFDKTKIENPNTIVIEVFNIATPTVE